MKTHFLVLSGGRLAYDDQGQGPLVLCMPGMGDMRAQFRLLTPVLVAAGYRVVCVDPRGMGESSVVWDDYSVAALGADLLALIAHLQAGPAVICGNSMAAGAAVWAAARAPEQVAGLVLLGGFVRDTLPLALARTLYGLLLGGPWGPAMWRIYFRQLFPNATPPDFDDYLIRQRAMLAEPGRFAALKAMMHASKADAEALLPQVKAPTLVVMGSRDIDFPKPEAEARWVAQQLNGEVLLVPDAGHYPHVDSPALCHPDILAFVRQHLPQPCLQA